MKKSREIVYILIILVLVIIICFFLFKTYTNYTALRAHRNYLRQQNPSIESWMTLQTVITIFKVPQNIILKELQINDTLSNEKLTIDSICKQNHLNCTQVVNDLNHHK